jgi:RHS repeat-associated protein
MKAEGHPDEDGIRRFTYDGAGRVSTIEAPYDPQYFFEQTFDYDAAGNAKLTWSQETDYYAEGTLWDASLQYYSADQKLRVIDRFIGLGGASDDSRPGQRGVFEEHRYDALGRRVLSRVRRGTACSGGDPECASYVQRTVWDGDQVLWEVRAKGADTLSASDFESDATYGGSTDGYAYGRVSYIHGHGIDQPIGVTRSHLTGYSDVVLIPHANWRGLYEAGSTSGGALQASCAGSTCPDVDWPGTFVAIDGGRPDPQAGQSWMGSLIAQGRDGSGLDYRRNRYYNPETGQFTQEDPIGLAGGANLYGFAGGDPVNFADPFGLCPAWMSSNYDADCDYDRDGRNSGSERAAYRVANASNSATKLFWNVLGIFNTIVEDERSAETLGFLAGSIRLPGQGKGWIKLRGNQGWKDAEGNIWKKDMKHKDHWDVTDRKGNKVREVDYEGNQIWPGGPKNRNKR